MVKIVTDTLSDVPAGLEADLGLTLVPLNLHFGEKVYRDRIDITIDEFYRQLASKRTVHPTTSAPGPGVFINLFKKLSKETDAILCVMASGKMSAIGESACLARDMVKLPCRIEVVDSKMIAGSLMLAVVAAAEVAKAGKDLGAVMATLRDVLPRIQMRIAFDTLEYLRRGGRIGKASALLGSLLKFQPVLGLKEGELFPYARPRSRALALKLLVSFAQSFPKVERLAVEDAATPDEADALAEKLGVLFPSVRILRGLASPVIGAHTGPHVIAVSVLEGKK